MGRLRLAGIAAMVLSLVGCTANQGSAPAPTSPPTVARTTAAPTSASPSQTPTSRPTPTPTPSAKPHPVSVQALIEHRYDGRGLRLGRQLDDVGTYRRQLITYRGDGLTISGVMAIPDGDGPFPVLVLAHGYINPETYFPGQGMPREHDYLARAGYVVLHTDYRGHASSDDDPDADYELRLPYAIDVINAALAVRESRISFLDKDRIGLLGRSMGGGVALNALVAQPGVFDAAVIYASVSSLAAENWRQFYRRSDDRAGVNRRIERTYGLPDQSPDFWRAASARTYFSRVTEPIQVHHGLDDETCPIAWSRATVDALENTDNEVELITYRGQGHTFDRSWQRSIERTDAFFNRHLQR